MTFSTNVVAEREKNIKQFMRAMAMHESAFWLSWTLIYMLLFAVFYFLTSFHMLAIRLFDTLNLAIVFFILLQLFSLTVISFGMLFYYTIYIPRKYDFKIPVLVQWIMSLFFPCAFAFGIDQALHAQRLNGDGHFPPNLFLTRFNPDYMTVLECIVMLSLDSAIYIALAIYSENIRRLDENSLKTLLFFVHPSYWLYDL